MGENIYVQHEHRQGNASDMNGDFIGLCIERAETTKTIEAEWNTKGRFFRLTKNFCNFFFG